MRGVRVYSRYMEFTTTPEAKMTTARDFTYNVYSDDDAAEFFALMARASVQPERIAAMKETRENFLAGRA